jgi:hypothetical protein
MANQSKPFALLFDCERRRRKKVIFFGFPDAIAVWLSPTK